MACGVESGRNPRARIARFLSCGDEAVDKYSGATRPYILIYNSGATRPYIYNSGATRPYMLRYTTRTYGDEAVL